MVHQGGGNITRRVLTAGIRKIICGADKGDSQDLVRIDIAHSTTCHRIASHRNRHDIKATAPEDPSTTETGQGRLVGADYREAWGRKCQ